MDWLKVKITSLSELSKIASKEKIISNYVSDKLKAKKVVLYTDNASDYAKGIAKAFREAYKGEIVADETFVARWHRLPSSPYKNERERFWCYHRSWLLHLKLVKIVNQARGMGIDKPIVGGDGFNGEEFVQQATAEKASNIYFISGFSTTVEVSLKQKPSLMLIVQNTTKSLQHLQPWLMTQFTL